MNLTLLELEQHEAAWLAYGKRRASRLRWKKATNAEVAATLDIAALTKKIEAHDKRVWIARVWFRVFTSIERQREMLVYCLGQDVFAALKQSPVSSTLMAQRVNLDKLTEVTKRTSRFSWFKKPLNAFLGWAKEKIGNAIVVSQYQAVSEPALQGGNAEVVLPVVLDTPAARERFREKLEEDRRELEQLYKECSDRLHEHEESAERLANFEVCFKPYKKKLRELKLYYHPDKVTHDKAAAAGLTDETFVTEVGNAFIQIQSKYTGLEAKRIAIRDADNRIVELDRLIIEGREQRLREEAQLARKVREQRLRHEAQRAMQDALVKEHEAKMEEHKKVVEEARAGGCPLNEIAKELRKDQNKSLAELGQLRATLVAAEGVFLSRVSKTNPVFNNTLHEPDSAATPATDVMPSTNPSALFAMNPLPVHLVADADKLSDGPILH